jgi:hypothetical protein
MAQNVADEAFTKSEASAGGSNDCLEVAKIDGGWVLRDSTNHASKIYLFDSEYNAFLEGVKANQPGLVP